MATAARHRELRDGLEAIQGDMAEHQRITGRPVAGEANRQLARDTFEELDRAGQLDRPTPAPAAEPAPELTRQERRRLQRELDGKVYTVTRDDDAGGSPVPMSQREREMTVKALRRFQMLLELQDEGILGAPSWRQRACAVMEAMARDPRRGAHEMDELLNASDRLFGDWRIDPVPKVIVG